MVLAAAVALLASCSVLIDPDRLQCTTDMDCLDRGAAFADSLCIESFCQPDPRWSCLDDAPAISTLAGPFAVTMRVTDLLTMLPKPDVRALLCNKVDVDCSMPQLRAVGDAAGLVTLQVPRAYSGYVQLEAEGTLPGLYFFNPPIDRDQELPPVSMVSPIANSLLVQQLGATIAPDHGNAIIFSETCTGTPAAGVSLSTANGDALTKTFYSVQGLPSLTATATDAAGYGGMVNLPSGAVTVTGTLAARQASIGTISMLMRPGAISYSRLAPRGD